VDVPRDLLAGPVVVTEVPDGQGGWGAWSGVEIDKDDGPAVSQRQQGRAVGRVSDALWADQAVECLEQLLFGAGAVELDVVAAHVELCEPAVPHNLALLTSMWIRERVVWPGWLVRAGIGGRTGVS
jgi:hypothetical protein